MTLPYRDFARFDIGSVKGNEIRRTT